MPPSDGVRAERVSDSRGSHFVLTDEISMDDAQVSGRWLAADRVAEVRR